MRQKEQIEKLNHAIRYMVDQQIGTTYYEWVATTYRYKSLTSEYRQGHFQALMDCWFLLYMAGFIDSETYRTWYDGFRLESEKLRSETPNIL